MALIGNTSVFFSFCFAILACILYLLFLHQEKRALLEYARMAVFGHILAVFASVGLLYYLIFSHQYQYFYVWKHNSNELSFWYLIACFWEGQEGSFLLWIFFHACIFIAILKLKKSWESPTMVVMLFVQAFLLIMVLGLRFGGHAIGTSPFAYFSESVKIADLPLSEGYAPQNGNGINALLQNFWMVIHPPVVFLGYALALLPFAMVIAHLFFKMPISWKRYAYFFLMLSLSFVLMGIFMGAYWAYETLNFGGYWSWDPVENAIFIPCLILIGALHLFYVYYKTGKYPLLTFSFVLGAYVLILYASFLTRSGILGNSSVHAFTETGLSVQLALGVLFALVISIIGLIKNRNRYESKSELNPNRYDFWVMIGALVLFLAAFQVLLPTSFPVLNKIGHLLGKKWSFATPGDQVLYYSQYQMWFSVLICIVCGYAQYKFWRSSHKSFRVFQARVIMGCAFFMVHISIFLNLQNWSQFLVIGSALYVMISTLMAFYIRRKTWFYTAGGVLSHFGMGIMILGILFSALYKTMLTDIQGGNSKLNKGANALLVKGETIQLAQYNCTYLENCLQTSNGQYIPIPLLRATSKPDVFVLKENFASSIYRFAQHDSLVLDARNQFYKIAFQAIGSKDTFYVYPRMQFNAQKGIIASPDIVHFFEQDIYAHVTNFPDPNQKKEWATVKGFSIAVGETEKVEGNYLVLDSVLQRTQLAGIELSTKDRIYEAFYHIDKEYASSYVVLGENGIKSTPAFFDHNNLKVILKNINQQEHKIVVDAEISVLPKDWITLKAISFPFLNLFWIGGICMMLGLFATMLKQIVYRPQKNPNAKLVQIDQKKTKELVLEIKRRKVEVLN